MISQISVTLFVAILGAVQGMFQFGYNTGVMNAPSEVIEEWIAKIYKQSYNVDASDKIVKQWFAYMVSAFPVGGMLGSLVVPAYCKAFGPRQGLLLSNIVGMGSAMLMTLSIYYGLLIEFTIGRGLIGVYSALCMSLVPLYLSEISPTNLRGGIGTLSQLAVTVGIFLAQILGQPYIFGSKDNWFWLFVIVFIPSSIQLLLLFLSPESPRYLMIIKKEQEKSIEALMKLRNLRSGDLEQEIEVMRTEEEASKAVFEKYGEIKSIIDVIKRKDIHRPLILGIIMHMSQQLTGINGVFYYSTSVFLSAGFSFSVAAQTTSVIGIIMMVMTLITVPLMDRLGRRTLHLTGLGGMFVFSILLTISLDLIARISIMSYVSALSVMLFTIFFAMGPGSIPFTIMGELFTQSSRARAVSICVFVNWFCNFLVAMIFPLIQPVFGTYVFVPFTLTLALFWVYLYINLPETKNRTFEEIAALFAQPLVTTRSRATDYASTIERGEQQTYVPSTERSSQNTM